MVLVVNFETTRFKAIRMNREQVIIMGIMERVESWFRIVKPEETNSVIEEYKGKGDIREAVTNVFLGSLVPAGITLIMFAFFGIFFMAIFGSLFSLFGAEAGALGGMVFGGSYIVIGIVVFIAFVILAPVSFLIGEGIYFIIARALGGTGKYKDQAHLSSFVQAALLSAVVLQFVPCVGALILLAASLYSIYLKYRIIKGIHGLDTVKSIMVIVLPIIIVIGLVLLFYLGMFAFLIVGSAAAS